MKYKNMLLEDDEYTQLVCMVEFENDMTDEEYDEICDSFESAEFEEDIYISCLCDTLIEVSSDSVSLDEDGVELLQKIYHRLETIPLDGELLIGVYLGGNEWFTREDGSEYNMDMVSLEEFLKNVEF